MFKLTYFWGIITYNRGLFMLEILFGNETTEKILFYLFKNKKCYGNELARCFSISLSSFQKTLQKLEKSGLLVSFLVGKTRVFEFNPRYPFLKELIGFLDKAYSFLPEITKKTYYEKIERKRPRRTGKPL